MSDLTPEQAQILAQVQVMESGFSDASIEHDGQGNPIEPEPSIDDVAAENAAILGLVIQMMTPLLPFLPDCYPPETIQRIALAYTAVEEKHGWNARELLSVEVQLAIVAIPPSVAAVKLGLEYFEMKKQLAKREAEKVINPGGAPDGSDQ